jgi:hypothetical protein
MLAKLLAWIAYLTAYPPSGVPETVAAHPIGGGWTLEIVREPLGAFGWRYHRVMVSPNRRHAWALTLRDVVITEFPVSAN